MISRPIRCSIAVAALALLLAAACSADDDTDASADAGGGAAESDATRTASADDTSATEAGDAAASTEQGAAGEETGEADATGDGVGASDPEGLRERIAESYPQFRVDAIHPTPLDGIYEVVSDTDVMYMTADARYLLRGALIDLQDRRNLTSERHSELVHAKVEALGEQTMLVFPPASGSAEHTITVFTDHTCPYCQRLHEELLTVIEEYPVEIRYLMFPRAGLGSKAAETLQDIWCAEDPRDALTRAKRGQSVPARDESCNAPVREHFEAARAIGINGTPYLLVGEDGPAVSGYRPKEQLLSMLGITPKAEGSAEAESGQRSAGAQ